MITAGLLTTNIIEGNTIYAIESKFLNAKSKFAYDIQEFKNTFISSTSYQKNYVLKMIGAPIENFIDYETLGETYRQLIIQGAPGTGKSHYISEYFRNTKPYFETVSTRMVCHPESTNADFIGVYKPETIMQNGQKQVIYAFQPGVFTSMLTKALMDPTKIYVIILEEINRANSAAMFADVFQLLDRDADGYSTYRTFIGKDVSQYLLDQLTPNHPEYHLISNSGVALPPNLWIWATMNTADQGVFPMDTAFKRRWMFKYIGLNDGTSWQSSEWNPEIPNQNEPIKWQDLRQQINDKLEKLDVEVDRQLGAYFLTKEELASPDLLEIIIIKVIGYLRDDVVRYQPDQLFISKESLFKLRDKIISSKHILGIFK
jgi:5-methylcytosine-specific restriction endonuclease McrBC GTP-binding regulatory subunit McrB